MPPETPTTEVASASTQDMRLWISEYLRAQSKKRGQKPTFEEVKQKRMVVDEELAKAKEVLDEAIKILNSHAVKARVINSAFSYYKEVVNARAKAGDEDAGPSSLEGIEEQPQSQENIQFEGYLHDSELGIEKLSLDDVETKNKQKNVVGYADSDKWETY
ncbi:hypothetical protein AK830_g269 [Neonectria ditissima]|uniref:Uncharacterized protein n=1 Tax=Neonectria ditissima TaxID=78410 RepID=A0A0P7BQA3_9HYPO|nr:hypothetical protein AK830_g269 [Neonectria ditissima]